MANRNPTNKMPPKNGKGAKGRSGRRPNAVVELARELASRHNVLDEVAKMVVNRRVRHGDRIRAAELLLAYAYGRPAQSVKLDADLTHHSGVMEVPPREEKDQWRKRFEGTPSNGKNGKP